MPAEVKKKIELEIAHVLFLDIVGYSKLSVNEQHARVDELNGIVRLSEQFQKAEAANRILKIPTGDGMALVFYKSPEEPAQCAFEISRALKDNQRLQVRMGIHSGPVSGVVDVNERTNVTGAGINMAQRVMNCGDAGHILLSKHVAEDLAEYESWRPLLHDLGTCEVKHGARVGITNLYSEEVGNAELPRKFQAVRKHRARIRWAGVALALLVLGTIIAAFIFVSRRPTGPSPSVAEKSIAVLPFENLSRDPDNAFFTDGVQDEILMDLSKVADLKVISRTSVMQYKNAATRNLREIGQQLGVAHVLEGSVQRAANRVRVTAQLIDARTDAHLWAEGYDRDLADVFVIQSEIAKKIADQLRAKISPSEKAAIEKAPTADVMAFDLYQRSKSLWAGVSNPLHAREKLPEAVQLLDEAVARDPKFVLAWCLLSRVHCTFYWLGFDHTADRLELASAAVQTALSIQEDSGDAHLALANYFYFGFLDYDRARSELAIAKRTLPNNADIFVYTGFIDRRQGHWEDATRNLERALELDPRNLFTLQHLATYTYYPQRRYADAVQTYDRALTIVPGDPLTRINRAEVALDWRGDVEAYQTTLRSLIAENPKIAPDVDHPDYALCERTAVAADRMLANYPHNGVATNYGVNCPRAYWEGVVARSLSDSRRARNAFITAQRELEHLLEKQPDFVGALSLLGVIDAGLGRKDEAIREGRRACELLPISKDAIAGAACAVNLAQIYAWTGEKDLAIEQIAAVERVPNDLSYGRLKLHPYRDSLRDDPRFKKIVSGLAPK